MTLRVLVLGAVHPGGGPESKMRGLTAGFDRLGCTTATLLVPPGRSAIAELRAGLDRIHDAGTRPDVVVARSHWTLPPLVDALRRWQRRGTRIVVDSPTPTSAGMREIARSDRSLRDRALRTCVEALWIPSAWPTADLVMQYDDDGWPWRHLARRRRLTVTNGIDVAARPLSPGWSHRDSLHLVTAGATGQWHGIDRLLYGLVAAGSPSEATLPVVGNGPELRRLEGLTRELGLGGRVHFTGVLTGSDFDAAMASADVGVASLGEHRRGRFALSPLKTRDYLARGLPVLFAGDDPDLRADLPFAYRCPGDDSPIPVAAVGAWLESLRRGATSPEAIRAFAVERLDQQLRARWILRALGLALPAAAIPAAAVPAEGLPAAAVPASDQMRDAREAARAV